MFSKLNRFTLRGRSCITVALLACTLVGCSTSGGSLVLFPKSNRLLPEAECIALSANRCPPPRELAKQPIDAIYVQPGDLLLLELVDLDADVRLPADQTVLADGTIDLGEYGRPVVAGMTLEEIESVVLTAVRAVETDEEIEPINVRLTLAESNVYYVLGEVNAPGSYPLIGRETVLDALMAAGGLADNASDCEIILSRPTPPCSCRVVLPVCYNQIVQLGDTTTNYQVRPGDRIYVATRSICEQLRFWSSGCKFCPDCSGRGCRNPLIPLYRPFSQPAAEQVVEPAPLSPSELMPMPVIPSEPTQSKPGMPVQPALN